MSSVINYEKFDKIDISSSDDDNKKKLNPHLTKLDNKDKVVIGPNGLTILKNNNDEKIKDNKYNKTLKNVEDVKDQNDEYKTTYYETNNEFLNNKNDYINVQNMNNYIADDKKYKDMFINGAVVPYEYIWNQSIHYINAFICLPLNCKAKNLIVDIKEDKLIVKKKNYKCGINNNNNNNNNKQNQHNTQINSFHDNVEILVDKKFPFKINTDEDTQIWEIKNMQINWYTLFNLSNEINNQNVHYSFENYNMLDKQETFLYISVKKINEIENAYIWWSTLFKNEHPIKIENLPSRSSTNKANNTMNSFKTAWDEAHEIFKKNISMKQLPFRIDSS
ncbi:hypothetical protein PRSY57_1448000 [Plasmodium reichenowi]|uniref:CS domain-containing protein n=1 Tax=Plasmodium reichenowi TaxID=5854 RepID=A0A151L5B0_PLARE|nr:hypothetical protein PRSY57_1448000 [Plasmodium reichenowi]KYN94139.1 hypothetical protein PRSY57_1448000 [Plasmodium reichenowi]